MMNIWTALNKSIEWTVLVAVLSAYIIIRSKQLHWAERAMITSSAYARDWYGHAVNQCGHGILGLASSVMLGFVGVGMFPALLIAIGGYVALIEFILQPESRIGGSMFFDGMEDAIHFGIGAGMFWAIQAGGPNAIVLLACWSVILGYGVYLRGRERT